MSFLFPVLAHSSVSWRNGRHRAIAHAEPQLLVLRGTHLWVLRCYPRGSHGFSPYQCHNVVHGEDRSKPSTSPSFLSLSLFPLLLSSPLLLSTPLSFPLLHPIFSSSSTSRFILPCVRYAFTLFFLFIFAWFWVDPCRFLDLGMYMRLSPCLIVYHVIFLLKMFKVVILILKLWFSIVKCVLWRKVIIFTNKHT